MYLIALLLKLRLRWVIYWIDRTVVGIIILAALCVHQMACRDLQIAGNLGLVSRPRIEQFQNDIAVIWHIFERSYSVIVRVLPASQAITPLTEVCDPEQPI